MIFADLPKTFIDAPVEWVRPTNPKAILGLYHARFMLGSLRCQVDANIAIEPPVGKFMLSKRDNQPVLAIQGQGPLDELEKAARKSIAELAAALAEAAALISEAPGTPALLES